MNLNLLQLRLHNFKGIADLEINFNGSDTSIFGKNETGKTSIYDGFLWLLFGKNSEDKKDFSVKTLDSFNEAKHKLEHEVSGTFSVDGRKLKLTRTYKEKWVKKRGESTEEFTGHETIYGIDDVTVSAAEYQRRVDSLIREDIFKMVTNPLYFNAIKWQDRRTMLIGIAGDVDKNEILQKPELADLKEKLLTTDIESLKKEVAAKKKPIKESLEALPYRIDEQKRSIPEHRDWVGLETRKAEIEIEIRNIDAKLAGINEANKAKFEALKPKLEEINRLKQRLVQIEYETNALNEVELNNEKTAIINLNNEIYELRNSINNLRNNITFYTNQIATLNKQLDVERAKYSVERGREFSFDEASCKCPTCNRVFENVDVELKRAELEANFNAEKANTLTLIIGVANNLKDQIAQSEKVLSDNNVAINTQQTQLDIKVNNRNNRPDIKKFNLPEEYNETLDAISKIQVSTESEEPGNQEIIAKKSILMQELDDINLQFYVRTEIENKNKRIKELETTMRAQSQELADLERIEFAIETFDREHMTAVEQKVNKLFNTVRFKMFNKLINGGFEPVCDCLVNGVPYPDVNTAGQTWAGMEIINVLNKHYDIYAPIFIDNRESVTLIPSMDTQVISLIVSPEDKVLRVA